MIPRKAPSDLAAKIATARGLLQLGVAGTIGAATLAEAVHRAVVATAPLPLLPTQVLSNAIAGIAYAGVRRVAGGVGKGADAMLCDAERRALGAGAANRVSDLALPLGIRAAMNGVIGDQLDAMCNPVALPMSIEHHRFARLRRVPENASGDRVLFVHGLCMTDRHWQDIDGAGVCFGEMLFRQHGHRPSYLRYNSGLAIAENGRRLADLMESRQRGRGAWHGPLHIVAHSLGGLVVRSALAEAQVQGHGWPEKLRHVVFLGTPHGGAPLERVGKTVEGLLAMSRFSAPWTALGRLRSVAVRQLGAADLPPLGKASRTVHFHAVAGTISRRSRNTLADFLGDGLVPRESALAEGLPADSLPVHTRRSFGGVGHFHLTQHPEVADHLVRLLSASWT